MEIDKGGRSQIILATRVGGIICEQSQLLLNVVTVTVWATFGAQSINDDDDDGDDDVYADESDDD